MKHLIIIPFALPWEWSADYEKETAKTLGKNHVVIAFLIGEGIALWRYIFAPTQLVRNIQNDLYVCKPLYILPFQRNAVIRKINFYLASLVLQLWIALSPWRLYSKIYWSFSLQYAVFPSYFGKKFFSIYDCVDAFVTANASLQPIWKQYEERILKESDIVLVNSNTLFTQKKDLHPHVIQTSEGLFSQDIYDHVDIAKEPSDLSKIPHPRVTFVGNINKRLNFPLIKTLISLTPRYSYVFIGGEDPWFDGHAATNFMSELAYLKKMKNCYFLGKKQKTEIPRYIRYSDVGFIPYDISLVFNKFCYPMKIQEYFYMGKPVLCTPIEEVKRLVPYVTLFRTADEGKTKLRKMLSAPMSKDHILHLRQIAISNSIAAKCLQVESIIKNCID